MASPILTSVHELNDGSSVRLRLTRPSDEARVRAFLETLSEPSRYRRFLSGMQEVPDSIVSHFTFYEPRERMMLAATSPVDGTETIVGLADVALLETGLAEIAIVVGDGDQGRGVGKLLSQAVATLATQRGATHLRGVMAPENKRMLHLMERLGDTVTAHEDGALVAYTKLESERARNAA